MTDLTYVELFAGAGGMSLGLEAAGWTAVAHAEIEPHARAVLRKHWPDTPLEGDVSQMDGSKYAGVTLLTGGSPCQDLSIAGKRAGMTEGSGTRSSLFFEQVRIWQETQAPYILWENVCGALSSNNGRDFAAVLSALVGAAVPVPSDGWESAGVAAGPTGVAAWRVLDAQWFSVPQRRRRVFVLGVRPGGVDPAQVLLDGDGLCGDSAPGGEAWEGAAPDAGRGAQGGGGVTYAMDAECNPSVEKIGALNTGSATVVLPAVAVNISNGVASVDGVMGTLGARSGGQEVGNQTRGVVIAHAIQNPGLEKAQNGLGIAGANAPMYTLEGTGHGVVTYDARGNGDGDVVNTLAGDHANRVTDYTPIVMRQREGKPGGGKGPLLSEGKSLTLGTTNDQVVFTRQRTDEYQELGVASTIAARDYKSASDNVAGSVGRPRRLMPVECEALMGWPRDWTALGIDEQGREYALKDTPRYKLCGNGCAAPVIQWIAWRLAQVMGRS